MYHWLNQRPFLALNPMQKAEILAFLCNELLCSRAVIRQIDNNIEAVNSLRKDKWLIEGDLRKLKCIQQKRVHTTYIKQCVAEDAKAEEITTQKSASNTKCKSTSNVSKNKTKSNRSKKAKDTEIEENDIGGNESGNDTDDTQDIGHISDGEQQTQYQNKLTRACHTIRATTFGQDRYKRRYWVLPYSGGIFVEGLESADPDHEKVKIKSCKDINDTIDFPDDKMITIDKDIKLEETNTHSFNETESEEKLCTEDILNVEKIKTSDIEKGVNNKEMKEENSTETELKISTEWINHKTCSSPKQGDVFSPFTNQYVKSGNIEKMLASKLNSSNLECDKIPNSLLSGDQNWFLQSPFFASILASNMFFNGPLIHNRELNGSYFNFPKGDISLQDSSFGNFFGFSSGLISPEQVAKNCENSNNQSKPWFSILPRMPCEHNSAVSPFNSEDKKSSEIQVSNHLNSISSIASTSSSSSKHNGTHLPLFQHSSSSNLSSNPNHAAATAMANLQAELMNGFFIHPFLGPQPFGHSYQNGPTISNTSTSSTNTTNTSIVTNIINNTSNSLQLTNSEILSNFGLPNLPPASSTPSSIPTPSATPGPSHGSAPSSQRETPSPSFCRKYFVDKQEQYEEPQPIPLELQRGWWRITDSEQLKQLLNALHPRGIREKMLKKQLQKLYNYACASCSKENHEATDLEITDLDREISQKIGGTPDANSENEWFPDVALRIDLAILEHVESMEEKVASASMQVKGWKMQEKLSNDPTITFHPACDSSAFCSSLQDIKHRSSDEEESIDKNSDTSSVTNKDDKNDNADETEINEDLEQRTDDNEDDADAADDDDDDDDGGSLKDIKNEKDTSDKEMDSCNDTEQKILNPVEAAKERLLLLEAAIERRYLRAPLGTSSSELKLCSTSSGKTQNTDEKGSDDIPVGLFKWRESVKKCKTSGQLAMCINLLETCVAWDKSIMRASCQFCHNGDNEEMLLLCDGCDKGYHTYCFKPKMESIPDGDWYCYECISKVTGERVCVLCGKKGKLLSCDGCPKTFHLNCLEPPLSKITAFHV
ncbi:bromodomain adjacent to zinc finger domain protein 2B-like isoform X1 [Centruroides sculpturatus]|uniref:bromodomain adjacent to zinc finger domain protein 2B-like isoform X1 n=1 Tax=Centruroides sculpturatus TaxID=218467 RepID=UPI000C6E54B0|nr:bromodomain adjacent to zinc finger domain protein 2B-like isoform X1 [Centruroides sculpturatus]